MPDLSAHASLFPGWPVLFGSEWLEDGGNIVSGDNGFSPKAPPQGAGPGYDLASGLGVPHFDRLAAALPPPAG